MCPEQLGSFAHALQPEAPVLGPLVEPSAIVADEQPQLGVGPFEAHSNEGRVGVLSDVVESFLENPHELGLGSRGQSRKLTLGREFGRQREAARKSSTNRPTTSTSGPDCSSDRIAITASRASTRLEFERPDDFVCEVSRLRLELSRLDQTARLQLREPQILRQPVVDLPREPGPLLERRGGHFSVAETAEINVRGAQRAHAGAGIGFDPEQDDAVERDPQDLPGRDERTQAAGIEGDVELAERRHDEAEREIGVGDRPATDVEDPVDRRAAEEHEADERLDERSQQRNSRRLRARARGGEMLEVGHRNERRQAATDQHGSRHQPHDDHRGKDAEHHDRRFAERDAAEGEHPADEEQQPAGEPCDRRCIERDLAGLLDRQSERVIEPGDLDPEKDRALPGQWHERRGLEDHPDLASLLVSNPARRLTASVAPVAIVFTTSSTGSELTTNRRLGLTSVAALRRMRRTTVTARTPSRCVASRPSRCLSIT